VEAAPRLTSLTLIKCPWLTNSAVKHLQHLRGLAALSLADNGNIRCGGGRPRAARTRSACTAACIVACTGNAVA
jgi:hypothetical protein